MLFITFIITPFITIINIYLWYPKYFDSSISDDFSDLIYPNLSKTILICSQTKETNILISNIIHRQTPLPDSNERLYEALIANVLVPIFHDNGTYLIYCMISFLTIGYHLEKEIGKIKFAWFYIIIRILTCIFFIIFTQIKLEIELKFDPVPDQWEIVQGYRRLDPIYKAPCATGFAGILIAMRLLDVYFYPNTIDITLNSKNFKISRYFILFDVFLNYMVSNQDNLYYFAGFITGLVAIFLFYKLFDKNQDDSESNLNQNHSEQSY